MSDIKNIAEKLTREFKKHDFDYIEARLEESQTSHITYRGKELESIGWRVHETALPATT